VQVIQTAEGREDREPCVMANEKGKSKEVIYYYVKNCVSGMVRSYIKKEIYDEVLSELRRNHVDHDVWEEIMVDYTIIRKSEVKEVRFKGSK